MVFPRFADIVSSDNMSFQCVGKKIQRKGRKDFAKDAKSIVHARACSSHLVGSRKILRAAREIPLRPLRSLCVLCAKKFPEKCL